MNDNDNVVSLRSGKSLKETEELDRQLQEDERKKTIEVNLAWIDKVREAMADGAFIMPLMIAYSPSTGMFFSDFVAPAGGVPFGLAHSYVAQLELMKLTMAEIACEGPLLAVDGSVLEAEPRE